MNKTSSSSELKRRKLRALNKTLDEIKKREILGRWENAHIYKSTKYRTLELYGKNRMWIKLRVSSKIEFEEALRYYYPVLEVLGSLLDHQEVLDNCDLGIVSGTFRDTHPYF